MIKALLDTYPEAANADGQLPLHDAAAHSKSEAVVKMLLAAYPDATKEKDRNGQLPKDLAKTDAIKALLVAPLSLGSVILGASTR